MATSWTSLCNQALYELGADSITDIDSDTSDNAVICRSFYEGVRDELLRDYTWNFSITRAELSVLTTTPEYGWDYEYTLPSAPYCLRILEIEDNVPFSVEGRKLLTDQDEVKIKYIARVTNAANLDVLFQRAYVLLLASRMCVAITRSNTLKDSILKEFEQAILTAKGANAIESKLDDDSEAETDLWTEAGR